MEYYKRVMAGTDALYPEYIMDHVLLREVKDFRGRECPVDIQNVFRQIEAFVNRAEFDELHSSVISRRFSEYLSELWKHWPKAAKNCSEFVLERLYLVISILELVITRYDLPE